MTPRPAVLRRPAELRAVAPPETAVLTPAELARWLHISERQLDRIDGVPYVTFGKRSRRAVVRDVLAWLEAKAKNGGRS